MRYELKDTGLIDETYWYVNRDTVKSCMTISEEYKEFESLEGDGDFKVTNICKPELPGVYSFKLFSPEWCARLVNELKGEELRPNPDEDELRQIPEFVIGERCLKLFELMKLVNSDVFCPVSWSLFGQEDLTIASAQVAHYNPKGKKAGAWHHDASADFTVVIPLNTGEYVGGGTEFFGLGTVEPLDTGSALIFPATSHMHRGLAVESGDRYLLVFWLYIKPRALEIVSNMI